MKTKRPVTGQHQQLDQEQRLDNDDETRFPDLAIDTTVVSSGFFCNGVAQFCDEQNECPFGCSCIDNICR